MEKTKIIAIVGMPGSGKSTVANFFKENGFGGVYFGGIVVETVKSRGLEVNEKNERSIREELRKKEGMAVMAVRSLPEIDTLLGDGQSVVIDDMYSFAEYKLLSSKYADKLKVVAVMTPREIRYKRLAVRTERPLATKDVHSRDFAQIEKLDIGGSIAVADYYLLNDGTLEDLIQKLRKLELRIRI